MLRNTKTFTIIAEEKIKYMETLSTVLLTIALVSACLLLFSSRKSKSKDLEGKVNALLKAGDYKGLRKLTGKYLYIWGALFLLVIALAIVDYAQGGGGLVRNLAVVAVFGYKFFVTAKEIASYKKAEKMFGYALTEKEYSEMWACEDDGELISNISDLLYRKSWYYYKKEFLNEQEKNVYILGTLIGEVENGGFSQFFYNTRNALNEDMTIACRAVGAEETARICAHALDLARLGLPEDELDERLEDECDNVFYDQEENPTALCASYARNHRNRILESTTC